MSLKKLSLILLTIICFNAYSMEEQKNAAPTDQSVSPKFQPKDLKFICAQYVLKNDIDTKALPSELKDTYLEFVTKLNELEEHNLAPVFKKYLIESFDHLSIDVLQQILAIIDTIHKMSTEKCLFIQKSIPTILKTIFCDSPLTTLIGLFLSSFSKDFKEHAVKLLEEGISFYTKSLEIKNPSTIKFDLIQLNMMDSTLKNNKLSNREHIKQLTSLADNGHAPSFFRISAHRSYGKKTIKDIEKLIKMSAIDYASELIIFIIPAQEILSTKHKENLNEVIGQLISLINEKEHESDYDLKLMQIYIYLDNKSLAKKHAERFFKNNEGVFHYPLHKFLIDLYEKEGKNREAEVHLKMIKEFENIMNP